jgi:hypothetical protein
MTVLTRPLVSNVVGISLSPSEDSEKRGFPAWQVNRVLLQFVSALFGQGAGTIFGHDWRPNGVMETIHGFAQQMQSPPTNDQQESLPLLQNLLPWPDRPMLTAGEQARIGATLRIEQVPLPPELGRHANANSDSPGYSYLRARALTNLRRELAQRASARICVGGPSGGSVQGRYPGIVEEALLTVQSGKSLYLAGFLGGATAQLISAVKGEPMPGNFCPPTAASPLYQQLPAGMEEADANTAADRTVDPAAVWMAFHNLGIEGLSAQNGLTPEENAELFDTPVIERAIQLVLTGMARVQAREE